MQAVRGMFLATLAMEHGHKLTAVADPSAKKTGRRPLIFSMPKAGIKATHDAALIAAAAQDAIERKSVINLQV